MLFPAWLQPGCRVALAATARPAEEAQITSLRQFWEGAGCQVVEARNLRLKHHVFAGTPVQRREALQQLLDDPTVAAIHFVRGGYGTAELLPGLDWSGFLRSPKWLIGHSDLTPLLMACLKHRVACIHGPMAYDVAPNASALAQTLFGEPHDVVWQAPGEVGSQSLSVAAEGVLWGGNLSLLQTCLGTPWWPAIEGGILVLEDTDEYLYRLHRMLGHLGHAGVLKAQNAVLVGDVEPWHDNPEAFGAMPPALLTDAALGFGTTAHGNFPIGHLGRNQPLVLGAKVRLEVHGDNARLRWLW